MSSGQWEGGCCVVECSSCPCGRCMTGLACGGKSCGYMVRVCCLIKICLVATNAVRGGALVISSGVTLYAGKRSVRAIQRKSGDRSMVELSTGPCNRCVAL